MKQTNEGKKSTIGIVSGIVSLILGGGSLFGCLIFLIVTVFAAIGLAATKEGTDAWTTQNALVNRYEFLAYLFGAIAVVFVALGIVLLVIFIKKKRNLKKEEVNTEAK